MRFQEKGKKLGLMFQVSSKILNVLAVKDKQILYNIDLNKLLNCSESDCVNNNLFFFTVNECNLLPVNKEILKKTSLEGSRCNHHNAAIEEQLQMKIQL